MSNAENGAYGSQASESMSAGIDDKPAIAPRIFALYKFPIYRVALLILGIVGAVMVVADRAGWPAGPRERPHQVEMSAWEEVEVDGSEVVSLSPNSAGEASVASAALEAPHPTPTPTLHMVAPGDSLLEIAANHGVPVDLIARANDLWDPNRLRVGQTLIIPMQGYALAPVKPDEAGVLRMWWPLQGEITTNFGEEERYYVGGAHTGIDFAADVGAPVRSSAAGKVVVAWKRPDNVGSHIVVDHGDGWSTLYGHLSRFFVDEGDSVERGEVIGAAGNTGFSFGPHLHFEVRRWGVPVDPLKYLP